MRVSVLLLLAVAAVASAQLMPGEDAAIMTFDAREKGEIVFEDYVQEIDAGWMRLRFRKLRLNGNTLRLTSAKDGAVQHLNDETAAQWGLTSAYFNGDIVRVEVLAGGDGPGHFVIALKSVDIDTRRRGHAGKGPADSMSICFNPDTRVFSNDTRQGRYIYGDPNGCCTAWITDAPGNCFLSAGHCTDEGFGLVEFNVPLSESDGTLVHPGPEDQYIVDQSSMQTDYNGITNDWRFFGVFPNSEHGLTPLQRYSGSYYSLLPRFEDPSLDTVLTIIGYGENESFPPEERRVLKTASGAFTSSEDYTVYYRVDTSNGNSGSAVYDEETGYAVAIHTNGGCNVSNGRSANYGTSLFNTRLQTALANPRGVCAQKARV